MFKDDSVIPIRCIRTRLLVQWQDLCKALFAVQWNLSKREFKFRSSCVQMEPAFISKLIFKFLSLIKNFLYLSIIDNCKQRADRLRTSDLESWGGSWHFPWSEYYNRSRDPCFCTLFFQLRGYDSPSRCDKANKYNPYDDGGRLRWNFLVALYIPHRLSQVALTSRLTDHAYMRTRRLQLKFSFVVRHRWMGWLASVYTVASGIAFWRLTKMKARVASSAACLQRWYARFPLMQSLSPWLHGYWNGPRIRPIRVRAMSHTKMDRHWCRNLWLFKINQSVGRIISTKQFLLPSGSDLTWACGI